MNDQKWEFCCLHLYDTEDVKGKGKKYSMDITYVGEGGHSVTLATMQGKDSKVWTINPFYVAMQQLGSFGWDLVSIQHGTSGAYMYGGGKVLWFNAVAWFKRAAVAGRRVDEPKLIVQ